jgi:double-stranded uracil-DNA glycosylase
VTKQVDKAFEPIIGETPRVLILGSMPSQRSLASSQYYGNPNNAFWWIMGEVFDFDAQAPYLQRCEALKAAGLAVWDVIERCHRPGSLDSDIDKTTVQANNFAAFFATHPTITSCLFNGQASQKLFKQHMGKGFLESLDMHSEYLPSTSPAHASMSRDQKFKVWKPLLQNALAYQKKMVLGQSGRLIPGIK